MATDVVDLLERDHREVERTLASLAESDPGAERETLATQLAAALSLHMQFEEEHLYPLVQELDPEAAEEANVEHQVAREGLQKLEALLAAARLWRRRGNADGRHLSPRAGRGDESVSDAA